MQAFFNFTLLKTAKQIKYFIKQILKILLPIIYVMDYNKFIGGGFIMSNDILISAIFLLSFIIMIIGCLWALFTAFSKKSTFILIASIAIVTVIMFI